MSITLRPIIQQHDSVLVSLVVHVLRQMVVTTLREDVPTDAIDTSFGKIIFDAFQPSGPNFLLQAAALISCGLGLSALPWSLRHLSPVLISVKPGFDTVLALVPTMILQSGLPTTYSLRLAVESWDHLCWARGNQFVLVAHQRVGEEIEQTVCYFPLDVLEKKDGIVPSTLERGIDGTFSLKKVGGPTP